MNSVELKRFLQGMAYGSKHPADVIEGIVDMIIAHYMTVSGYMENHAVETMQGFLKNQTIIW